MELIVTNSFNLEALCGLGLFILVIALHELGHYWRLLKYVPDAEIVYHDREFVLYPIKDGQRLSIYEVLNKEQTTEVYVFGLIAGIIPVLICFMVMQNWIIPVALLILYAVGCVHDLKQLRKLRVENNESSVS